jgi:hypothetical protein
VRARASELVQARQSIGTRTPPLSTLRVPPRGRQLPGHDTRPFDWQVLIVSAAWIHGCVGLHTWLRLRPWWGIEGRISVLMRGRGMKRCRAEGAECFALFVGAAVLANNLMIIGALMIKRSRRRGKVRQ